MKSYLIAVTSILMLNSGCAKFNAQREAAGGGLIGSYNGDYIVRNDSGGVIMDVWVLSNTIVSSETNSDGWFFVDSNGNVVHLGGDCKVIRVKDKSLLSKYHEYHREFETVPYEKLYAKN
jgi:hypothetical protein